MQSGKSIFACFDIALFVSKEAGAIDEVITVFRGLEVDGSSRHGKPIAGRRITSLGA